MKIEIINRPRCSGKTTLLKLKLLERYSQNSYVYICGHDKRRTMELQAYAKEQVSHTIVLYSLNQIGALLSEQQNRKWLLVLIDEPFKMPRENQIELLSDLKELEIIGLTIDVFGIGTYEKEKEELFSDYIGKEILDDK